jgi:hypothetical protein
MLRLQVRSSSTDDSEIRYRKCARRPCAVLGLLKGQFPRPQRGMGQLQSPSAPYLPLMIP